MSALQSSENHVARPKVVSMKEKWDDLPRIILNQEMIGLSCCLEFIIEGRMQGMSDDDIIKLHLLPLMRTIKENKFVHLTISAYIKHLVPDYEATELLAVDTRIQDAVVLQFKFARRRYNECSLLKG